MNTSFSEKTNKTLTILGILEELGKGKEYDENILHHF